jgi:hypothetical protein
MREGAGNGTLTFFPERPHNIQKDLQDGRIVSEDRSISLF